jgi:hypothetical protein
MSDAAGSWAWQHFHLPKEGHAPDEYEDAFAGRPAAGRFAVADGASESAFAGTWGRILVRTYVRKGGPWSDWLPGARRRWRRQVEGRELPWYAEAKAEEGAFAALLAVACTEGAWEAQAVGDCCLFQVRGDFLRRSFPVRRARDFSTRPNLLGSRSRTTAQVRTKRTHLRGDWRTGDVLYLMTDALAHWFLSRVEDRGRPWEALREIQTPDEFVLWVQGLRRVELLRNDDVTLVRISQAKSL